MVEPLVLRLRRLRAVVRNWLIGWLDPGQSTKPNEVIVIHTPITAKDRAWAMARKQLVDALLLATLIITALYAPTVPQPWLLWMISSGCAGLLGARGIDWREAWFAVFVPPNGRTA